MAGVPTTHFVEGWGRAAFWPQDARWRGVTWLFVIFCAYVGVLSLDQFVSPEGVALLWLPNAVLATAARNS